MGGSGKRGRGPVCVRAERLAVAGGTWRTALLAMGHTLWAGGATCGAPIQQAAMPQIAKRSNVIVHSATGSGKTLAFLVPILSRLEPQDGPLQLLVLC